MHTALDREVQTLDDFINEQSRRERRQFSALAMYNGDMWDKGRGYIGPVPVKDDDNASVIMGNIKRMFTSRNVIKEVVDRTVDGLLSKSPDWKIYSLSDMKNNPRLKARTNPLPESVFNPDGTRKELPKPAKKKNEALINEAELLLSNLWTDAELGDRLKDAVTRMLITGEGKLRIYIPAKRFGRFTDIFEVARYVKVEFVENTKAVVLEEGGDKLSIVEIENRKKGGRVLEISFTTDNGQTIIGAIDSDRAASSVANEVEYDEEIKDEISNLLQSNTVDLSSPLDLGGNTTCNKIVKAPFVTESMLQNNRALNLTLSLGVGILIESGYAEMVTTNVALKTKKVIDEDGNETEEPVAIERGPSVMTNLVGEQTVDAQGNTEFQTPGVHWKEPSPLTTFVDGENLYYTQILKEARQLFITNTDTDNASGEARIQARQDFLNLLRKYKTCVDNYGTWLLNTIIRLCAAAAGKNGYFKDVGIIFDSKVSAGELSADEKNVVISMYTAEPPLISREEAMVLLGNEDPLITIDKIRADQVEKLEMQVRRLEATAKFGNMAQNGKPKDTPADDQNRKTEEADKKV